MSKERVIVIGCGGIGSYYASHIDKLIELKQLDSNLVFEFYDDDEVELKNILYQNFTSSDIDSSKTDALSLRYFNVQFINKRLTEKDLEKCKLLVLCADNNKIRKEAWNAWTKLEIPFIDARANGKAIGVFSSETSNYLTTINDDDKPSSCQNPFQIAKKEIEYGNVIVAAALAQVTLNYSRNKKLPADFMISF